MNRSTLARRAQQIAVPAADAESADTISFGSGDASPAVLPDLVEPAQVALSRYRAETLQYAPRMGLVALRRWICQHLETDHVQVSPEEVLIVNGAKHGLDLICRLLLDEGDSVVVTAPTYFTAIPIFRSYGVEFIQIGQDTEGMDVAELESVLQQRARSERKLPKLIYDITDFHNPTGLTMSRRRREALIAVAAAFNVVVVEDSPYRRVRFEGPVEPSLRSLDSGAIVYALGTFSKLMAPGLRVGWVVAPADMIARMAQLKSDGGSCPLTQRTIVEFCERGLLDAHVATLCAAYTQHRDRMIAGLRRELPAVEVTVPHGGYYTWLKLPDHVDGENLASRALGHGVSVLPGTRFFASADKARDAAGRRYVRLAYSFATLEQIDEGLSRLARAYAEIAR